MPAKLPGVPSTVRERLKYLCCLFCCPPCPSHIATKLAFYPQEPSYAIQLDESSPTLLYNVSRKAKWCVKPEEQKYFEMFYTRTSRGNQIACMFVKCSTEPKKTILFSHGNAVDLGDMSGFYFDLGSRLNCNIFSYDYSGYGESKGRVSEKDVYADVEAAWQALQTRGLSLENVVLYGISIGTVPTVDLASKYKFAGVVLHSPLMSGIRVLFPDTKRTWCFDSFVSIDKVGMIKSPVLVIHGTRDQVIDISHGQAIFENCTEAVEPLWIEGADHNNIGEYQQYMERLKRFINSELAR